jgi:hypothetical protein
MEELIARGVHNRSCIPRLNDCGNGPGTNKMKQKCKEYVSPVNMSHPHGIVKAMNRSQTGKLFRNKDCLQCVFNTVHGYPKEINESACYNPFIQQKVSRSGKLLIKMFNVAF